MVGTMSLDGHMGRRDSNSAAIRRKTLGSLARIRGDFLSDEDEIRARLEVLRDANYLKSAIAPQSDLIGSPPLRKYKLACRIELTGAVFEY